MATKKNPSIYDDRGAIGSSDELDEYGVWVKLEPQELSGAELENLSDFDDGFDSEFSLDEDIGEDFPLDGLGDSAEGGDAIFNDLEALRPAPEPGPDQSESVPEEAAPQTESPQAEAQGGKADLSSELLLKISEELSSIKGELAKLKGELATIRNANPDRHDPDRTASANEAEPKAEGAGFFGEADDDKISLTGDELDTIIHAADFAEGAGPDIEAGVLPVSPPPDDTGYLEDDPLAEEHIDLSDAVIDEPDLSEGIKEAPLEEPSLDKLSQIDLDAAGGLSGGAASVEAPSAEAAAPPDENLFLEDISFEDLAAPEDPPGPVDLSNAPVLDNDLSEVSFESISFEAEDNATDTASEEAEIALDLPPLEIDDIHIETEPEDLAIPAEPETPQENADSGVDVPPAIRGELKNVLAYMDKLLESLPEEKIEEFAQSEYYETYTKLFEELGIQ
jgi:hypothetical protein